MSSPFAGSAPFEVPFSGTTDASGNLVVSTELRKAFFTVCKMIALTSGNPSWLVEIGGDPAGIGRGARADIGPMYSNPAEIVRITISGATPNATVRGAFRGKQYGTIEQAASDYAPASNVLSIDQAGQAIVVGNVVAAPNTSPSTSFPVPTGTVTIGFEGRQTFLDGPTVKITGDQSGLVYFNTTVGTRVQAALLSPFDTSVTMQVFAGATSTTTVDLLAWSVVPTAFVRSAAGTFLDVNLVNQNDVALQGVDGANRLLKIGIRDATNFTDALVDASNALRVQEGANPPLWQAPRAFASNEVLNAVTSVTVLAGVVGQTVRVFGWNIEIDQATGTTVAFLEDSSFAVGAVGGRFAAASSNGLDSHSGYLGGLPLAVAAGVRLNVALLPAATGAVRAQVSYSQG